MRINLSVKKEYSNFFPYPRVIQKKPRQQKLAWLLALQRGESIKLSSSRVYGHLGAELASRYRQSLY